MKINILCATATTTSLTSNLWTRFIDPFFGDYHPATALFEIARFFQNEALIKIEDKAALEA